VRRWDFGSNAEISGVREDNLAESEPFSVGAESGRFDLNALAKSLPVTAGTMLIDKRLTDEPAASSRIFRIYRQVPAHYHKTCDEYLVVISGSARIVVGNEKPADLSPGQMQFFRRGVVHGFPEILEHPFVIFSVDTPRRDPSDVHFMDADAGTRESFIRTIPGY
jgi:mannose-6-phosphate isomerase-like protein (cupin superfamily)